MRALVAALVSVAAGGLFSYDASAPVGWRDAGVKESRDGVVVRSVSFAGPRSGRVTGYLVLPPGNGPFPAVVWLPGSNGTPDDVVEDARGAAKRGIAALLPQPAGPVVSCSHLGRERELFVRNVLILRRSLDALSALPQIDRARLGAVGFSYGAIVTASAAGVEPRLRAIVLDSGRAHLSTVTTQYCGKAVKGLDAVDPARWVGRTKAAVLVQNGKRDTGTPRAEATGLARAAHTTAHWYDAWHPLDEHAFADRDAFLARELGATRAPAAAAATDPCPAAGDTPVTLKASDGASIYGVEVGSGTTGVVLAHQYLSDHCELIGFARELARDGYRALSIDFRGYGASTGGDGRRLDRDVAAAAARLRADGAQKIVLVGASMGGTAVLAAAAAITPRVDGVVSLSGPAVFRGLDALAAVKRSTVPVRFVAGRRDRAFAADARRLATAARSKDKLLALYPYAVHGSSLLELPGPRKLVLSFLRRTAGSPSSG